MLFEVIVDRLCGEAVLRGSDIFGCGIMALSRGVECGSYLAVMVDLDANTTRGTVAHEHVGRKV